MEIDILFFGQVAEIAGIQAKKVSQILDTAELTASLSKEWPQLQHIKYSVAVNKKIVHENTALQHGDTVAILPPFSGG